jgi:hypothetical protein
MHFKTSCCAFVLCICLVGSVWAADNMQPVTDPVKVFKDGYIQVIGFSEEGQSRYKAIRAAQVVAQRDLVEVMQGLKLYGTTSVRDGMLESDEIKTSVEGFLRGAANCGQKYHADTGYAEVCMRVNIRGRGGLYDILLPVIQDEKLKPDKNPDFVPEKSTAAEKPSTVAETRTTGATDAPAKPEVDAPSKLKDPYDGLIVDARDFQFRPALVNRVLTEGEEVVFEPSKILSNILVERGCGGFTTDDGKAKALLESWGSKKPMTIKCTDVHKLTDAKISQDDAAAVYVHDQKTNLLSQARVVFLLK